jgi:chromosome segregation ATPase
MGGDIITKICIKHMPTANLRTLFKDLHHLKNEHKRLEQKAHKVESAYKRLLMVIQNDIDTYEEAAKLLKAKGATEWDREVKDVRRGQNEAQRISDAVNSVHDHRKQYRERMSRLKDKYAHAALLVSKALDSA